MSHLMLTSKKWMIEIINHNLAKAPNSEATSHSSRSYHICLAWYIIWSDRAEHRGDMAVSMDSEAKKINVRIEKESLTQKHLGHMYMGLRTCL